MFVTTVRNVSPHLRNHSNIAALTRRSKSSFSFLPTIPLRLKNALTAFSLVGFVVGVYYSAIAKMSQKVSTIYFLNCLRNSILFSHNFEFSLSWIQF